MAGSPFYVYLYINLGCARSQVRGILVADETDFYT